MTRKVTGIKVVRTALPSVLMTIAVCFVFADAAAAKEICAPKIVNPADGGYASTRPTIKATAHTGNDCTGNAKKVKLEVSHAASGNTVYKHTKVRGKGAFTGRFWSNGDLLLDHTVPAGHLKSGERYTIYVEYPNTGVFPGFDEHVGCCKTSFRTGSTTTKRSGSTNAGLHTLVIDSRNVPGRTDYVVKADGPIRQVSGTLNGRSVTVQSNDKISGKTARGTVSSGRDGFRINGDVTSVELSAPSAAKIFVDGQEAHTLVMDGAQGNGSSQYELKASGYVQQLSGNVHGRSVSVQSNDRVKGQKAAGYVGRGRDGFLVAGDIKTIHLTNMAAADLYYDGRRAHTLVFDGARKSGSTGYTVKTDGSVEQISGKVQGESVSIQANDKVRGGEAKGHVGRGHDGFLVAGDIKVLSMKNPDAAALEFDGYQARTVVFDSAQKSGATKYKLLPGLGARAPVEQISGEVHGKSVSIQANDKVRGGKVTGRVVRGRDGFLVGVGGGAVGGISSIKMTNQGAAALYVDGQRKQPSAF